MILKIKSINVENMAVKNGILVRVNFIDTMKLEICENLLIFKFSKFQVGNVRTRVATW